MWGQRLPGSGGLSPGLVGLRLGGGAPYISPVPTAGGAAVDAVVWLDVILRREYEVRVASALRKMLPTPTGEACGREAPASLPGRQEALVAPCHALTRVRPLPCIADIQDQGVGEARTRDLQSERHPVGRATGRH